jgi:hypothetical protein
MTEKKQLTDLIFNLATSLDETSIRHSDVEVNVKEIRISVLGIPGEITIHVKNKKIEFLKIFYQDNIYTVLNCLKLVLFHELKRK